MESPFTDFAAPETITHYEEAEQLVFVNPLKDPEQLQEDHAVAETLAFEEISENEAQAFSPKNFEGVEEEVKIGDINFAESDNVTAGSEDFKDAGNSGNRLVLITPSNRKTNISKNFLVGEFIRAQSGKYTWDHGRLDPVLVENVQQLRNFVGRPIYIIDGYYPPKYVKQVLRIIDAATIARNPHISGRGVKLSVNGYEKNMLDIAIAVMVICDQDARISVGEETLALYVKQPAADPKQKFTSYIKDEKRKVNTINFCINFNKLISDDTFVKYGAKMQRATAKLLGQVLMKHYGMTKDVQFPEEIGDVISLMHVNNPEVPPEVILYGIAYSPFGNLARLFLKDKSATKSGVANLIVNASARANDLSVANMQGTFYYLQKQPNKQGFIKLCYDRYDATIPHEKAHHIVEKNFFNWKYEAGDKLFYQQMKDIIKKVYKDNGYKYEEITQQLPEGGTRRELNLSDPNPDKPKVDFTGRYYVEFPNDPNVSGSYLLINQAGNYISGRFGSINKKALRTIKVILTNKTPKNLKDTVLQFFGKLNENGEAVCDFPPQMSIILKKVSNNVSFTIKNNVTGQVLGSFPFTRRSPHPMISESLMNFFTAAQPDKQDLFVTLAWAHPLPSQLKKFGRFLNEIEPDVQKAITQYYSIEEDMQSVRTIEQGKAVRALDTAYRYVFLPNYDQFVNYCTRFFFSKALSWRPRNDRELMSEYDWIKRMLEDFRGIKGNKGIQSLERMYKDFGVDTNIPAVEYKYEVDLKTTAMGIGPASKISGTIVIENKTDYKKYPNAERWSATNNKVEYSVDFWNLSLSISLKKWLPKFSARWDVKAEGMSTVPYKETDFSGSRMDMVEWTAFDISAGLKLGKDKFGVGAGLTKRFLYIVPTGGKELQLEGLDVPKLPDTLTVEPADKDDEGLFDFSPPSVSFYRGEINRKNISTDISSLPLPKDFESVYMLQSTKYFKHDDGTLSPAAIEAIGRMCAEELATLSDPQSEIEIYGHTDASGEPGHNLTLSAVRAANTLQAIEDRLGKIKFKAKVKKVIGLGENEANQKFGQFTEKNAWLRRVVILINGRAVLSLGQL